MPIESAGEVVFQGGPAGTDGQSTYQAWLALGNVGSIVDFIAAQRGAPGPANALTIGTVSTGAPGSSASATITGQSPNQTLNLSVPQGVTGAQPWQTPPTAWAASTAYTATAPASSVTYGGESYVCATSHTSAQAFDASKWAKIAQKGADGSPAAGAVLYSVTQTLDTGSRRQARINMRTIGAGYRYNPTSFSASDAGVTCFVDAGATDNLPLPAIGAGESIRVFNFSNTTRTFVTQSASNTIFSEGVAATSFALNPYEACELFAYSDAGDYLALRLGPAFRSTVNADKSQSFNDAQKYQILANAGLLIPQAQCRLARNSATQLQLVPWNGNQLFINGAYRSVQNAPLMGNNGLAANTVYYIFAFWNAGSVAITYATTPPVVDSLFGTRIINNQGSEPANRPFAYVGAVLTDANGQFRDDDAFRGVASLFNPPRRTLSGVIAANGSTASTAGVALGSPLQFVLAEPTGCDFSTAGYTYNENAGQYCRTDITLDQNAIGYPCLATSAINNADCAISAHYAGIIPAGVHAANLFGSVSGGTGHWNAALFGVLG